MRKKINYLAFAFVLLLAHSCSKTALKNIEVDSQWNLALFDDDITVNRLLKRADSTSVSWLVVDEDGNLFALYRNDFGTVVRGSDLLSNLPTIEYSDILTLNLDRELLSVPIEFENFTIRRALLKSGNLNVSLGNNLPYGSATLKFTTNNILVDNQPLIFNIELKAGELSTKKIDLANSVLVFDEGSSDIVFQVELSYASKELNVELSLDLSIDSLAIKSLEGDIKGLKTQFGSNDSINFGLKNLTGNVNVSPRFYLEYRNTFGIAAMVTIDTFAFEDTYGMPHSLIDGDSAYVILDKNVTEYRETDIQNVIEQVDFDSEYCKLDVIGHILIDNSRENVIVSDESEVELVTNVELPLEFTANDLNFCDTVNIDFGDTETSDMLDKVGFHIIINNTLPITLRPQLAILDPVDDSVVMSIIPEGSVAAGSYDGKPVKSVIDVHIPKEDFDKLFSAEKMIVICNMDTEGHRVRLTDTQYFGMHVGLELHSSSISIDTDK